MAAPRTEKEVDRRIEDFNDTYTSDEKVVEQDVAFDEDDTKRLLKKVDYRLLPVLTLLYLMSFLDRSNIGNARVAGLDTTLGLSDAQYNMALTIFFFPYALFEVPSNIVLKILKPRLWLTIITLCWGTVMTLMGIVQGYGGLLAARFFLGVAEAGLFPACSFLLTTWYCRHEMQIRLAVFYSAASLAGAFSGLLAYALAKMEGVGGLEGWRWIFIIEGLITVLLGILLPFVMLDSPEKARFFTDDERTHYVGRLQKDYNTGGKDAEKFEWKYLWQALSDWKIYLSVVIFWGNTITGYGFIFTLPTAINDLGYSAENAQLLTIPIYVCALIFVVATSKLSDRIKKRAPFIIYPYTLCAIGFIILMALPKNKWSGARYGMLFVVATGLYTPLCAVVAWNANNLAGSWKRAIGMGLQITIGNLGGAVGSNIYLAREAPNYWTGYAVSLTVLIMAIVSGVLLRLFLGRNNRKRDLMSREEIESTYSEQDLVDMGDKSPLFRYTL